jgi:hypothetical protein
MEGADVRRERMSMHNATEPIIPSDGYEILAEVIELPGVDAPSFYQRNSGYLPKASGGMSDAHRRNQLPRPDNTQTTSLVDKIRGMFGR